MIGGKSFAHSTNSGIPSMPSTFGAADKSKSFPDKFLGGCATGRPATATNVDFDDIASNGKDDTGTTGTGVGTITITPVATPETATLSLLALGALGLFLKRGKGEPAPRSQKSRL